VLTGLLVVEAAVAGAEVALKDDRPLAGLNFSTLVTYGPTAGVAR
jgi:hypothetical protein